MLSTKPFFALSIFLLSSLIGAATACGADTHGVRLSRSTSNDGNDASGSSPTLSFNVSTFMVPRGQSVTLFWTSTDASTCVASGGWNGPKGTRGARIMTPGSTSTYVLTCSGAGGSVTRSVTVDVMKV